jgi:quercetin dioxygenase-like cupin family protein
VRAQRGQVSNYVESELCKNQNAPERWKWHSFDISQLKVIERLPGWRGRYFDSASMTFAHYEFDAGASIHEHFHPQEEVYEVIEGELELTISGVTQRLASGYVGIVPPNAPHSIKAISSGKVIVIDYPLRQAPDSGPSAHK